MQHYGAGRVADVYLGGTWKWTMRMDDGSRYQALLWGRLAAWAAAGAEPRIKIEPQTPRLMLDRQHTLSLDLRDRDYKPAAQASVEAGVTGPDGEDIPLQFLPDPRVDGRYQAPFAPQRPGEYTVRVQAQPAADDTLQARSRYLVVDHSPETQPAPLAEAKLQALAQATGGRYWHHSRIDAIRDLPMTESVAHIETRVSLRTTWAFLVLVVLALLPDWILRRRIGMP